MNMRDKVKELADELSSLGINTAYQWFNPRPWRSGIGSYQYSDAEHGLTFKSKADQDKALKFIKASGSCVYVSQGKISPQTRAWIKYRAMYAYPETVVRAAFSENPQVYYYIFFRGPSVFKGNWFKKVQEGRSELLEAEISTQKVINKATLANIKLMVDELSAHQS